MSVRRGRPPPLRPNIKGVARRASSVRVSSRVADNARRAGFYPVTGRTRGATKFSRFNFKNPFGF
jgi:hypothetical protein